ncbi:MAG: hypothetical protein CMF60_05225 [Magnetococcales bacterium]|nr:hypothetical protein [Magnetococcales bacterium]|tara:strand:- start:8689 stop:9192 length:504 start_codon:yes stop_codon:yes gene_type:complete
MFKLFLHEKIAYLAAWLTLWGILLAVSLGIITEPPLYVYVLLSTFCLTLSLFCTALNIITDLKEKPFSFPKVLTISSQIEHGQTVLLLDESSLFNVNIKVSIYKMVDDIELHIGNGYVETIRSDKKIQIKITDTFNDDLWTDIVQKNSDALKRTIVKPISNEVESKR